MSTSVKYFRGAVSSPHYLASRVGRNVLAEGGNAVEAAVAMAATLAVVYPHMTGLGGDSFWLVRTPEGELFAIDASGGAAARADLALYQKAGLSRIPFRGPLAAITVAGTVSGWAMVLEKAGSTLPLVQLLNAAISYARDGVEVTKSGAAAAATKDDELSDVFGYADVYRSNNTPLKQGHMLVQPALARTLERLVENGLADFYEGGLAEDIANDLSAAGSPISILDLRQHKAQMSAPLRADAFGAQLYNLGPPTQGFTSLILLSLFARFAPKDADGFEYVHGLVEATKQAFLLYKRISLGDSAYMQDDPQSLLNNPDILEKMAAEIKPDAARLWPELSQAGDTTWFGAMDEEGWSVSAIQSTYFEFGSGVVLPKTGIAWQNRGASFVLAEDGWNCLRPGRKPFHTLNPAMAIFEDGRAMVYGTMGGEGQPQTQAALFTRYARYGSDIEDAISAPRWLLGRTWGEVSTSLKIEDGFDPTVVNKLRAAGHEVELVPAMSEMMGHAGALVRHPDGQFSAACDPRSDGEAIIC